MTEILQAIIWNWYSSLKKVEFRLKLHSPVKNRSCSESTRCCVQCVIPLSWYPSVFWRMDHSWVVRTLDTTMGGGRCLWDSEARVRNWAPTREAIRSELEFTLLPVHGDIFLYFLHTKWYQNGTLTAFHPLHEIKIASEMNIMVHIRCWWKRAKLSWYANKIPHFKWRFLGDLHMIDHQICLFGSCWLVCQIVVNLNDLSIDIFRFALQEKGVSNDFESSRPANHGRYVINNL